jgi:hypothetical protein
MKLKYIRLSEKGMQVANGRLRQDLTSPQYQLTFISNIRCVKVMQDAWAAPIYIPLERLDNISPVDEASIK